MAQQVQLAEEAQRAKTAQRAPTAQQAERAKQASRAIHIDELKYLRNQNRNVETFLSNYNDPTELNSFIDALTNREAVSKKFGDTWGTMSTVSGTVSVLSFAGSIIAALIPGGQPAAAALATTAKIAAIPSIPAAVDVTVEKGIKPILAGKPKEALLNTLMNLGESMDAITNPLKGLVLEGAQGFAKGSGLTKEGRVNYDFDTDFFLTDMLLETIIDPLNWVEFGAKTALKSTIKPVAESTAKNITGEVIEVVNKNLAKTVGEITIEGSERITNKVSKVISQVTQDWTAKGFDKLTDAAKDRLVKDGKTRIQQALVNAIKKEVPKATASDIEIILRKASKQTAQKQISSIFIDQISDLTYDTLATDVIKNIASINHYSDNFQKFMTKGAMLTSGYGLGVEAARDGWKGLKAWSNNVTLNRLRKAKVFDNANGLDIKQWSTAKNIWEASYKYTSDLTGDISQRDMNSFYAFAMQQFSRDRQIIEQIMQASSNPLKKGGQLADQFMSIYGCDFQTYISYIKGINEAEGGLYTKYVKYLESTYDLLGSDAFNKPLGSSIKTGKTLFNPNELEAQNIIKNIQEAIKTSKTKVELTDKLYTIKLNNAYVNSLIINDPIISEQLTEICSSEKVGALLNKIMEDVNANHPEIASQIRVAVQAIKEAGQSFSNIKSFYNNVGLMPLPKIKGISADDFKKYIIDQIFNNNKPVSELLAEFESITLPTLENGLEVMLYDKGFKFADYPALHDQIANVYRSFLEAQESANIENVGATIVEDFTKSIEDLIVYMPDYANDLTELSLANYQIKNLLAKVKSSNLELLDRVFTDKETIFGIANTRQLTDAGLALKTVALHKNLDLFNIPADISGNVLFEINNLGASINRLKEKFAQYSVAFEKEEIISQINSAYNALRQKFIANSSFEYLKETTDPIEQFINLVEFNKSITDKTTSKEFKMMLKENLGTKEYLNILDPSKLMVTEFAWSDTAQSAWLAEKRLNESIINSITAYRNLSLNSKKITADFQAMRDLLSVNKIDRPKMLQQERYIKTASKINDMLEFFEEHYNSRFNKTVADNEINAVRNVLNNFPELSKKYSDLVDRLEKHWNGELEFQQSPKYMQGQPGYVDDFTPFWNELEKMNADISSTVEDYNSRVAKGLTDGTTQFNYTPITPWDPIREQQQLHKLVNQATDSNAKGTVYNFLRLSPDDFVNELAYRKRFVTFTDSDVIDNRLLDAFNKRCPENVLHYYDTNTHRHWYVLKKEQKLNMFGRQVYLNDNPIMRLQNRKQFNDFQTVDKYINDPNNPGITKTLNELDDTFEVLTGSRLGDSQGEFLDKNALKNIYNQMPDEVKAVLPDFDEWTDKQFFDAYVFNESVLGTAKSKSALGMMSSDMIVNTRNAITKAQSYLKAKNEYVNSVFDSQLSISSPNSIWEQFTDEELLEALQANPEYKLVVLADDAKYGMKTREILPTSVQAIKKAKELGGWILPTQTYKDMYNVVNHRLGSSGMAKLWSRIMYSYKFGYLCRPGAWIRNFIDTNLKSKLELGGEFSSYNAQAHKILDDINNMKKMLQARNPEGLITKADIQEYFAKGYAKYLDYDTFVELNRDFLSQGISGNIMKTLDTDVGGDLWNTFTELTGNIIDTANKTENYNRLAVYLYELDQGLDYTSALAKIAKTHFDYSFKTKAEQLADMIFPFATFSFRNYSYWIEQIEKHPWIMRNYIHLMKPHWDFRDYTPEELARDRRIQNQIFYGQLKLAEFNDKVLLFKANPSIQDAIQMFSDPINNVYEKLAAPIKFATGQENVNASAIPMLGPAIQSIQTMSRTGTPLPSVIGVQPKPKQTAKAIRFANPNLSETDKFSDTQYRVPKYRKNVVYDSYKTKGITRYRANFYPVIDIAHEIKMRYTTNVYNRIKNRVQTDVYKGIRYRIRLDANRFK